MPFHNRRGQIEARVAELMAALAGLPFELILVDDGSTDGGAAAIERLAAGDRRVRLVRLRRSFGQSAALAAGFDRARGAAIVTIDADGQTDPADIPALLAPLQAELDMVSGRRDIPRSPPTRLGNWLISAISGVRLHDYGCPLKAYRSDLVHDLRLYGDLYRFAPALAFWQGGRVGEVTVRERPVARLGRGAGLRRIMGFLIDLLTVSFLLGFTARPMQAIGRLGGLLLLAGALLAGYLAFVKLALGQDIGNRALTTLAVLVAVLGVQLLAIGLLAELAMRVYYETQNKPIYAVREELNRPPDE
jgi:glycosyltransferase involved in cell wall biosynthesis